MGGPFSDQSDFTLSAWTDEKPSLLPGYQLRMHLDVPRLVWTPARPPAVDRGLSHLPDPNAALDAMEAYILDGSLLFGMQRPSWLTLDRAFLTAPTAPPPPLPSFAQMKAWEDEAFYRRLGRPAPLFGAPADSSGDTLRLLPIAAPAAAPFFKLPASPPPGTEPSAPRPGTFGDVLSGFYQTRVVQEGVYKIHDAFNVQIRKLQLEWKNGSTSERVAAITFATPLAVGLIGGVLGASDARHLAFKTLLGVDIPVPWVRGLSFKFSDYGRGADQFLLGTDPNKPSGVNFGFKLDVLEAIPAVKKLF
jgi:hypothetical protein